MRPTDVPNSPEAMTDEPPVGAPWDLPPVQTPWVFFDLEMTGLDPERDAILELAFVRVLGGSVIDSLSSLVASAVPSVPEAVALHGLGADAVRDAPTFAELAPRVLALLDGAVPVAHGVAADVEFLHRALRASGHDVEPLRFVLDTVTLARRAIAAPRYTLTELSRQLGLPDRRWHRAGEDAAGARALFDALCPVFAPVSARDLWEVRVGQRETVRVRRAIAAQLTELATSGRVCTVVTRSRSRGAVELRGWIERFVPPHVTMRIAATRPWLKILRADRILRLADAPPAR